MKLPAIRSFSSVKASRLFLCRSPVVHSTTQSRTSTLSRSQPKSLQGYGSLKNEVMKNLVLSGGFFAFYFSATISLQAGFSSFVGSCGSFVYFKLLIDDIDNLTSLDQVPITSVNKMEDGLLKKFLSVIAHYRQAFSRRLLPLVFLGILIKLSDFFLEDGMSRVNEGCMLLGFLAYKVSLFLVTYDALKPQPEIEVKPIEIQKEEEDDFDMYGRKKPDIVEKLKDLNQ